ncbi:putative glycosyltransferase EpsJ [Ruminiclostridium hungatei]|uniref:Putative glycosyltransferase EpsJ n=1 Tax=Ruminiclostridium hungatei TaxID=48256 RepID=A0A1V4SJZ3_RUMHU|nr:glycosyltransferase [Ruminiclostridium hungatei]OPX44190.1 putative glycosyltransferase EpsJ [Ruminiclostridium hungatei]
MAEVKVSVIVAMYKAEKHLKRCIESIISQSESQMEIILINDGSPDRCGEIAREYAALDHRIRVIHKENGGVASARNCGLEKACGRYIVFVDSDDWIDRDYIKILMQKSIELDADIVQCNICYEWPHGISKDRPSDFPDNFFVKKPGFKEHIYYKMLVGIQMNSVWRTLYKREVLQGLRFDEKLETCEDLVFSIKAFTNARSFAFVDLPLYHYFQNDEGLTGRGLSLKKRFRCNFYVSKVLYEHLKIWKMDSLKNRSLVLMRIVNITFSKALRLFRGYLKQTVKMNILQIADYPAPYGGNFIASLEALDKKVRQNNGNVFYLFPQKVKEYGWIKELRQKGFHIYYYSDSIIKNHILLRKIAKKHDINIFHVHFTNMKISLPATLACLASLGRKKQITHMHVEYVKKSFIKELLRRVSKWGTFYMGCSEFVSGQLMKSGFSGKRVFCAENAIDFSRLDKYELLANAQYGIEGTAKKVLIFGYNWYVKGVDLALEAVAELIREQRSIVLLIPVAANKENLEQYILQRFGSIPPWVKILEPRNDIASYYRFADLFISPSRQEGFCYALVEAAYCKVPVVASDIPAQKNLRLTRDVWVKAGDTGALKAGIEKALYSSRQELLDAQKAIVEEHYELDRWARRVSDVYNEVIK